MKRKNIGAVILAAGSGRRMGGKLKQFMRVNGKPLVMYSIESFLKAASIDQVLVVVPIEKVIYAKRLIGTYSRDPRISVVSGGKNRRESTYRALAQIISLREQGGQLNYILIHDAARPLIKAEDINRIATAMVKYGGAVGATPAIDLPLRVVHGMLIESIPKSDVYYGYTPQGFCLEPLWEAHNQAKRLRRLDPAADNLEILRATQSKLPVRIVEIPSAIKVTFPWDIKTVAKLLKQSGSSI
ncbi:MAG: 2-C-methyl-D-erythritol 4-phosphate cytidylyltransferase [Undibacterium sp.]